MTSSEPTTEATPTTSEQIPLPDTQYTKLEGYLIAALDAASNQLSSPNADTVIRATQSTAQLMLAYKKLLEHRSERQKAFRPSNKVWV